ncbi:hypothetical protein BDV10DRAFT_182027 [Aspergillus recurvatus]
MGVYIKLVVAALVTPPLIFCLPNINPVEILVLQKLKTQNWVAIIMFSGWEFLRQLASNPDSAVIGLVRNKSETEKKVTEKFSGSDNVHIIQGDLTDYASLHAAATKTAKITSGGHGCLITNAGIVSHFDPYDPSEVLECHGNIHLFIVFIPLLQRGTVKKVIAISAGQAALDMIPKLKIEVSNVYAIRKAGLNTAVAKFAASMVKGILFMSVCPGMMDTGHFAGGIDPEEMQGLMSMLGSFAEYVPHSKGPVSAEDAVRDMLSVMDKASVENADGGPWSPVTGISVALRVY